MQSSEGIAYLLRKSPAQIMRYDLGTAQWLAPISLADIPTAFAVDRSHIFIASARKLERIDLDGSNKAHVANTPDNIMIWRG
ncbi:MAG: hypothetical protein WD490_06930 [Opitutales bacterium]